MKIADLEEKNIVYVNAKNEVSVRKIKIAHEDDDTIEAFCISTGGYKTFKKDRILKEFKDSEINEIEKFAEEKQKEYVIRESHSTGKKLRHNSEGRIEVLFTGFSAVDKKELMDLAKENEFYIPSGVTKNLDFLVCGSNAGPSKLKQAKENGADILNKETYLHLIETGEIIIE